MTEVITLDDAKQHNNSESCWIVVDDKVYDVSNFLDEHPGGQEILLHHGGRVCTEAFNEIGHSDSAKEKMKKLEIGALPEFEKVNMMSLRSSPVQTSNSSWVFAGSMFAGVLAFSVLAYKKYVG